MSAPPQVALSGLARALVQHGRILEAEALACTSPSANPNDFLLELIKRGLMSAGDLARFARMVIDAGASAVLGHGPHVVRPFELYRGKPVFYSLGNFVGYRSLSTQGKLAHSIVAEVRFSPQGDLLGAGIIPLKLDRSGIPVVDYSPDNLQALSGLLLEKLDHRPVLNLDVNNTTNW